MSNTVEEDWTFEDSDISFMTHGIHTYPARMIPQVSHNLIERYSISREDVILDPFCGSGGVLVEALLLGRNCYGIDLNPLACLLARVKTTPLDPQILLNEWRNLKEAIEKDTNALRFQQIKVEVPDFSETNITYWFKPCVMEQLTIIKNYIDRMPDKIREFFYVIFSSTVRSVSGTRNGEFKLYRIPEDKWKEFNPDVVQVFEKKANISIPKMGEFFERYQSDKLNSKAEIFESDTRKLLTNEFDKEGSKKLTEGSVNLIVTSPPYGDSHTTVAYGQFSRYSLIWLGYDLQKTLRIDRESLGGKVKDRTLGSKTLEETLIEIESNSLRQLREKTSDSRESRETMAKTKKEKRAKEVKSFFADLDECLQKLYKILSPKGHACFVLGNRTVNGIRIPSDEILTELGKSYGFERIARYSRKIPYKRIPLKSSPTNIAGQKVETMSRENIVVLRKV